MWSMGLDPLERIEAFQAIDIQLAIEVIDLVLECLGKQALSLDAHFLPASVTRLDDDALSPLDPRPVSGHGKAALLGLVVALDLHDLGVDDRRERPVNLDHRD